jgi:AcrR family transcriptional regulator
MSEQKEKPRRRSYRKRRRAEQEEETRLRITEAAVDLHGSVGPARTTISAVADRAGVQRATVYRHFPDEESLFGACSAHWLTENPLPDIEGWREVGSPQDRLRRALDELYAWYERTEYMIEKTTRDAALVPAMQAPMTAFAMWFEAAADVAMAGRRRGGRRATRAAVALALGFATWRSLVREQGLDRDAAVGLMAKFVAAAEGG